MKLNLKMIAAAVALVTAGGANAAFVAPNTANSGSSVAVLAFNTATRAYYIRDLGYVLNSFMPSSVTTLATDGTGGAATTGDKSPSTGLTLDSTTNPSTFADASFGTWLAGQTQTDIRWVTIATDSLSAAANGVSRFISSSAVSVAGFTNGQVTNYVGGANGGGLATLFGAAGLSMSGTGLGVWADTNGGLGANTLSTLGQASNLYYAARSAATGPAGNAATVTQFGNAQNFAQVTLDASGNFSYVLAAEQGGTPGAVPVPAAAWLLGSGIMALAGAARRKKAAAQA
jgi:hypothetical protein